MEIKSGQTSKIFNKAILFIKNIKTSINRIRAIIHIRPLITDTQTNTLNW